MRRAFVLLLAACDSGAAVFDAGPSDVQTAPDACFAFCQASGVVGVWIACGKIVDAAVYGACAVVGDAAALVCEDAEAPFGCSVHATTTGTCGVSISFEDAGTFDAETTITVTPPGCCGGILIATPGTIGVSPPCDASAD